MSCEETLEEVAAKLAAAYSVIRKALDAEGGFLIVNRPSATDSERAAIAAAFEVCSCGEPRFERGSRFCSVAHIDPETGRRFDA